MGRRDSDVDADGGRWARTTIRPAPSYGRYLEWVFAEGGARGAARVRVEAHAGPCGPPRRGPRRHPDPHARDGRTLAGLAAVVLAQGHLPAVPDRTSRDASPRTPRRHGLRHIPPANPADLDLSPVAPGEPVLLRGLGLNFFDHMALLTTARGGRFVRGGPTPGGRACAICPRAGAAAVRGLPARHPVPGARRQREGPVRPASAARPHPRRHRPLPQARGLRRRPDFLAEIWPLVAKEVETVYYDALLRRGSAGPPARRLPGPLPRRAAPRAPGGADWTSSGSRRPTAGPGTGSRGRTPAGLPRRRGLAELAARASARGRRTGRARQRRRAREGGPGRTARPAQRAAADRRPRRAVRRRRAATTWTAGTHRSTRSCRSARRGAASRR